MAEKFRVNIKQVGKTDNAMFTMTVLNKRFDANAIRKLVRDYFEAQMTHDLLDNRSPSFVVIKEKL